MPVSCLFCRHSRFNHYSDLEASDALQRLTLMDSAELSKQSAPSGTAPPAVSALSMASFTHVSSCVQERTCDQVLGRPVSMDLQEALEALILIPFMVAVAAVVVATFPLPAPPPIPRKVTHCWPRVTEVAVLGHPSQVCVVSSSLLLRLHYLSLFFCLFHRVGA